jgi:hypothetical protein
MPLVYYRSKHAGAGTHRKGVPVPGSLFVQAVINVGDAPAIHLCSRVRLRLKPNGSLLNQDAGMFLMYQYWKTPNSSLFESPVTYGNTPGFRW